MNKIEHVGIAVKSLEAAVQQYEKLFGTPCYKIEVMESESVRTAFFKTGENKIELLQSTTPDGVIARYIEKRGEGMHHIAFEVDDIAEEIRRLENEGFILLNDVPKRGADNKLVCFVHPKSAGGLLMELCQEIK